MVLGGPDVNAQEVREPPDLRAQRVSPGEPRRLPLAPRRIPGGPPANAGCALVEWRRGQRVGNGAPRGHGGGRLRLFRPLLDGLRRGRGRRRLLGHRDRKPAARRGVHESPSEHADHRGIELRPALVGQRVALVHEGQQILVRLDLLQHVLRREAAALDAGAGEPHAKLARLLLTFEERWKSGIVHVSDGEHARQHADRSLHGRLEGGDLRLVARRQRGFGGGLLAGGRVPRDLEEALGLGETLQRVEPPIHILHDTAAVRFSELDTAGDVAGRLRDEDLAGPGSGTDARGQVHGAADVIAVLLTDRLAGVDPDADRDPGARLVTVLLGHGLLDPDRAQDGAAGGLEGDHEAVALGLHDVASVRLEVAADDEVLLAHEVVGNLVAQLFGGVRESTDITEENGDGVGHRHFGRSPGTTTFAVRVFVHSGGASGGTKNSSRCVEKTRRLSKLTFDDTIFEQRGAP